MDSFRERLTWARKVAGVSQRALSRASGLTERHVSLLESKDTDGLTLSTVSSIAGALGVTVGWLASGEGAQPSEESIRAHVADVIRELEAAAAHESGETPAVVEPATGTDGEPR